MRAADRPAFQRLSALMDEGVWKEEGLSVASLAEKVGVPEHQLRALINGQLGYRNFPSFLNSYRIAAAQTLLSSPQAARRQVSRSCLMSGMARLRRSTAPSRTRPARRRRNSASNRWATPERF